MHQPECAALCHFPGLPACFCVESRKAAIVCGNKAHRPALPAAGQMKKRLPQQPSLRDVKLKKPKMETVGVEPTSRGIAT
ncbi:hypothetical protein [Geobacillus genomosp. 3]|uniref:hypothetical protein n=1 Tax=Geobacillus genomosp. 3 TaxID=1921421 RepID=UPI0003FB9C96|nr:hypothetical protein [Geobacillus genomosp. 3]